MSLAVAPVARLGSTAAGVLSTERRRDVRWTEDDLREDTATDDRLAPAEVRHAGAQETALAHTPTMFALVVQAFKRKNIKARNKYTPNQRHAIAPAEALLSSASRHVYYTWTSRGVVPLRCARGVLDV